MKQEKSRRKGKKKASLCDVKVAGECGHDVSSNMEWQKEDNDVSHSSYLAIKS